MDNKVEVEINGRIVRVAKHLLPDMLKFGATKPNQIKRDVPIELRKPIVKPDEIERVSPLPEMVITKPIKPDDIVRTVKQTRKPRKK
jgi:hypothetical protein